ncbi:AbrB family transcriptional regulator [Alkalibacillus aidingensis]|uniref:AbrB family transcriptional regulator n=1 Tax=Alkalibacillus aidingensis TaxID=2747607 RepID=UPI001660C8AE|nr:AbrB family transcriptional regulator [Alkalibacillus aidingensis]
MQYKKIAILIFGLLVGALFYNLNVPAGWLIGAVVAGIIFTLTFGGIEKTDVIFRLGLTVIGASIGLKIDTSFFVSFKSYLIPLFISIPLTLILAIALCKLLFKYSNLDYKTALFCCIPGGASEVIGTSKEAGADERIVASFHTARIFLFVLSIPLIIGVSRINVTRSSENIWNNNFNLDFVQILVIVFIIVGSIFLARIVKIPVGPLIYGMLLAFVVNQYLIDIAATSNLLFIIGQVIIGTIIGQKFDLDTFKQLKQIGIVAAVTLFLLFMASLFIAFIFSIMSDLKYSSSLLGTVPAGAAEMSSTAFALNLDPSIIAALQTVRLLTIYLLLPFLISYTSKNHIRG